ncbi:MAG: tetratricopeptide repeat protein, partial [Bryobacteraceae bacterium]|nr:tetratricopeptide repeat protein [Bryobacteraceae bacterium]
MSTLHRISAVGTVARKLDVIFVHGLGGDAFGTWRHGVDDSTSWPHWLSEEFPEADVWSLGYAASPTKWARVKGWFSPRFRDAGYGMALPDRAHEVLDLMVQRGIGDRPILFVGHSLGGLVVKQILRKSSDAHDTPLRKVFLSTRSVLFLATPHAGADLATPADAFRTVFGATVTIQDLRAHDAHLRDLFDWYGRHATEAGIRTASYFELRGVKGAVTIVNPTSARSGTGSDPVGLDEDHISIAKPRQREAQVCGAARGLVRHCLSGAAQAMAPDLAPAKEVPRTGDVPIPHELPPGAEEFFGRDAELEEAIRRLRSGWNTAITGAAGLGKTALAAKALTAVAGDSPQSLATSPFPDGIVFLDFYALDAAAERVWGTLADKLRGPTFLDRKPARDRAIAACQSRRVLIVIEGGEDADGRDGRLDLTREFLDLLPPQNRWLLLTRLTTQALATESVALDAALQPDEAARLFDSLTKGRVTGTARARVLELLDGHPLALTWAGNLLARGDDDPKRLIEEWVAAELPGLSDPRRAEHTLEWLFARSVSGLNHDQQTALAAAGLLARAPFPLAAVVAALVDSSEGGTRAAQQAVKALVQRSLLRVTAEEQWEFSHVLGYLFARKETGSNPEVRTRLGRWLHSRLEANLALDDAGVRLPSMTRDLEHVAALLRADDDQSLWEPLSNAGLYDFAERFNDLGRLGPTRLVLDAVAGWFERFPPEKANQPHWLRERSVLSDKLGNVLRDQGDLAGALVAYRESLQVSQRLAQADPSNADWQRDLSVSHNNVGNVLRDQGDLAAALVAYREMLQVSQRLAQADPSNAVWQRDLSVSQERVGNVLRGQGD